MAQMLLPLTGPFMVRVFTKNVSSYVLTGKPLFSDYTFKDYRTAMAYAATRLRGSLCLGVRVFDLHTWRRKTPLATKYRVCFEQMKDAVATCS